tara:strand:+ start:95 stop:1453 length:1359 start_codon:yes stop_codon:yes gene_type:complete
MGRAIFDDIKPPEENVNNDDTASTADHSIRNVAPLETQERETRRAKRAERRRVPEVFEGTSATKQSSARGIIAKYGVWTLAVVVLALALSVVGFVFIGKTTISIVPKQDTVTLSSNIVYTAYQEAEDGELQYTLITYTTEATETITATGSETVEEKASGKIIVYNNHSSAPQRLIKNTRFEALNGEIYRVRNSIVVPGKKSDGTPGAIEITVYADKAGEGQNMTAIGSKFTIPGLKGDPRYDTFHAELSEPIIGGFVGKRAIVDEDVLNATQTQLRGQLRDAATAATQERLSDTMVFFGESSLFTSFESAPVTYTDDNEALVREIMYSQAVVFDENELARTLATAALATPNEGEILIDNPDALSMTIVNKDGVDIKNDALIQFTFEGRADLTWQVDTESLKQDLVGKNSEALNTIMSGYPGIKSAQATIRPFWKNEFPSETDGISVELNPVN